jgi:2-polyprenyl-6-methoxyphenol hydroxylase-like FAD-dependent oxidoreductase
VVVGAGPGGLASAATLGSYWVNTLIVEQRTSTSTLPRANAASTGTMELLRRWGLERRARERSLEVEFQAWAAPTLTAAGQGEAIDVGFPTRHEAGLVSPTRPAAIGQHELEPLIEAHVDSLARTRLERGIELLSLERDDHVGHVLTLAGPGKRLRRVHARYVIGADGMRSRVRKELGIATDDSGSLGERLGVHFRAPLWERLGERRYVIYLVTHRQRRRTQRGHRWADRARLGAARRRRRLDARPAWRGADAVHLPRLGRRPAGQRSSLTAGHGGAAGRDQRPRPRPADGRLAARPARRRSGRTLQPRHPGPRTACAGDRCGQFSGSGMRRLGAATGGPRSHIDAALEPGCRTTSCCSNVMTGRSAAGTPVTCSTRRRRPPLAPRAVIATVCPMLQATNRMA